MADNPLTPHSASAHHAPAAGTAHHTLGAEPSVRNAHPVPTWVKRLMLGTDLGLLLYWIATATAVIPPYPEEILIDWNWSYLLLDLLAVATGLAALWTARRPNRAAHPLTVISLTLTHAAGLTALNFWVLRNDYTLAWWLPNLWLALFPLAALAILLCRPPASPNTVRGTAEDPL